ncbi:hypothetical protein ACHV9U_13215 [Acinetobacter johnsonii]|uniref:hypothetical protein n=1 Tax=Acinetobacter johnsonii TaxID=40214 RepID=UPI0002DB0E6B|nr:hypothetical protein [Acinetobacter johnsonii]
MMRPLNNHCLIDVIYPIGCVAFWARMGKFFVDRIDQVEWAEVASLFSLMSRDEHRN